MDLFGRFRSVDSADGDKSSGSGSGSGLSWNKISLEQPTVPFSGESRYLTPLWVSGNEEPREELHRSDSSQSITTSLKLRAEKIVPHPQETKDKIRAALKLLTLREEHVLVQFWSPHVVGKHRLLTTVDQPFGLGAADEGLFLYRRDSERNLFVVDKDHEEDDRSPPARVFRRGLPEWTSDLTNYMPKDFQQQECASRCNLCGYLALPVFDSTTRLCVGVLELLTSSKYMGYAFEVQQVYRALKTANLTTPQVFDCPTSNVPNERRQNELDKIFSILKVLCDIHRLPLAQTWAVSSFSCVVSHEKILVKSCSSFDTRCLGKDCMSTAALPFHVPDLGMWPFRKACRERHLEKSRGFVGRALLSHGSCFCGDVTKLSEEEYPLVHNARMSGLSSCFAIFLHSVEGDDDYVLEFFLPSDVKDVRHILNLVQTLKQNIEVYSGFEMGDVSSTEVVGPPPAVDNLSLNIEPHTIQISSTTMANTLTFEMDSSDSESIVANVAKTDSANVLDQSSSKQNYHNRWGGTITNTEKLAGDDVLSDNVHVIGARENHNATSYPNVSMQKTSDSFTDAGEKSNRLKQGRKRKIDSLTLDAVKQHIGTPIGEAAKSLGVSRSTLKRFCREHDISSWPVPKLRKHSGFPSKLSFDIYQVACLMVRLRRWRNKSSIRHAMLYRDCSALCVNTGKLEYTTNMVTQDLYADWQLSDSDFVHASLKQNSYMGMVTVKASFKDDMIKFRFPISSGLLELENEVAQRIKLKSRRLCLKYMDEDDDLILISCDADLRNLLGFSASNSTIKLIVQLAED